MTKLINRSVIPLSLCATSAALGQAANQPAAPADTIPPVALETKPEPLLNRFNLGFQLGFNLNAKFKHIGAYGAQSNPGPATGGVDHFYDDGYNRVDVTGNNHLDNPNTTWFWGYQNSSQLNTDNNTISMHSTSSPGATSSGRDDDPQPGFQLTYSRELIRDHDDRWRAGFEAGFGYTDLEINDSRSLSAPVNQLTDTYGIPDINGFFVPDAPYSGTYDGPGRVISDTPTRSFDTTTTPVSGTREFGADLFAFRLGPYFEVPLNKTFSFEVSGGLAMVYAYSTFRYNETVITPNGPLNLAGHGKNDDVLFGGYLGGQISAALNEQWSLYANAQWMDVGTYTHRSHATGESAVLDLSQAVFFSAGIGYSF